jgi:hypothetical protein
VPGISQFFNKLRQKLAISGRSLRVPQIANFSLSENVVLEICGILLQLPVEILGEPGAWWQLTFAHPSPVAPIVVETGDEPKLNARRFNPRAE